MDISVRVKHPHVLEFLGICTIDNYLHLVSPYVSNGNLFDYVQAHPKVDRIRLVSGFVIVRANA
jgi:serine/threonine protein kinase